MFYQLLGGFHHSHLKIFFWVQGLCQANQEQWLLPCRFPAVFDEQISTKTAAKLETDPLRQRLMPDLANWNTAIKACGTCQQWECLGCQDAANMFHVYVIVCCCCCCCCCCLLLLLLLLLWLLRYAVADDERDDMFVLYKLSGAVPGWFSQGIFCFWWSNKINLCGLWMSWLFFSSKLYIHQILMFFLILFVYTPDIVFYTPDIVFFVMVFILVCLWDIDIYGYWIDVGFLLEQVKSWCLFMTSLCLYNLKKSPPSLPQTQHPPVSYLPQPKVVPTSLSESSHRSERSEPHGVFMQLGLGTWGGSSEVG